MTNSLETLLQQIGANTSVFPPGSRYYATGQAIIETPSGNPIIYLKRRIIPLAVQPDPVNEHTVVEQDRLDNITAGYIGDPLQFWQIADFNNAIKPEELTDEPGNKILLP
jgi:hypothetical protein